MDYVNVLLRTIFFYFFIFFVYRIMGKREVGQLGIIDLIVSILIAELVVISIENYNNAIWYSIVPIITLTLLQVILAFCSLKIPPFRKFLDGTPSIIMKNGKLNFKEMAKQKYNIEDLLTQVREKGYRNLEEIEYAILESNGSLSVFPYDKEKNKSPYPIPLIIDGKIEENTMKDINKTSEWLENILKKKNLQIKEVFYAFFKERSLFIIKKEDIN